MEGSIPMLYLVTGSIGSFESNGLHRHAEHVAFLEGFSDVLGNHAHGTLEDCQNHQSKNQALCQRHSSNPKDPKGGHGKASIGKEILDIPEANGKLKH